MNRFVFIEHHSPTDNEREFYVLVYDLDMQRYIKTSEEHYYDTLRWIQSKLDAVEYNKRFIPLYRRVRK